MRQNDIDRIERYINGLADENEKKLVESFFLNGEDNSTLRQIMEKDWDKALKDTLSADVDLSHNLDRIHHIIRKKDMKKGQRPIQKIIRLYMKAAAIMLFPILLVAGIGYIYVNKMSNETSDQLANMVIDQPVFTTIYSPMGSRVSFVLPDGSSGMLNSGSKLSYSLPFSINRKLKLEGEAWFKVTRDKNHPFEVSAGNSSITVLGTSFNLSAYPSENYVEVVLQEGKVEFSENNHNEKVTIKPSERLVFQGGNIFKSVTDPSKFSAWTEGKLVFRGDPMDEVARRIERWYNVKVILANPELEKYSFRGTFEDDNLEEVLKYLAMTSPMKCKIKPRKMFPDGTFRKAEVTIYLNN